MPEKYRLYSYELEGVTKYGIEENKGHLGWIVQDVDDYNNTCIECAKNEVRTLNIFELDKRIHFISFKNCKSCKKTQRVLKF